MKVQIVWVDQIMKEFENEDKNVAIREAYNLLQILELLYGKCGMYLQDTDTGEVINIEKEKKKTAGKKEGK